MLRAGVARSTTRWVGVGASALCTAGALLVAPSTPVASAADCADAEVVFARGTDESPGLGRVGDAFVDALREQAGGMTIDTYAVDYKASKLQRHGGDGAKDAIAHIKSTASSCPDTQIVLGGYSQGASVVNIVAGNPLGGITWADPLPSQYAANVAAVATFGDVATRTGESLSSRSTLLSSKAIDLCNPNDPICHAGPGNEWSGHTEGYIPVYTTQAAVFVAARLLAGSGQTVPGYGPALPEYGTPDYDPRLQYGPTTPGYGPDTSLHGPPPGYDTSPGYGLQPPDSDPSTLAPVSPDLQIGLVSAVR